MEIKEYHEKALNFSRKASENIRNLAFAGIAIIWVFKNEVGAVEMFSIGLKNSLFLFVAVLLFDFIQYFFPAIFWLHFWKKKKKKYPNDNDDVPSTEHPFWAAKIVDFMFYIKGILIITAYGFLITELVTVQISG